MGGYQQRRAAGDGGKCTGNRQHKWYVENRRGEDKNSTENAKANELIRMAHECGGK